MTDLKNNIIEKIRAGQVAMKPRWHFMLETAMWVAALLVVAMIAVYLLSFVFFVLYQSGVWVAPIFGWSGLLFFVVSSPWLLITLVAFFLLLLYLLVTHFSFSYQKPLVYSLLGTVLFVIGVSSFIQYLMIHELMQEFSQRHQLPGFAPLYKGAMEGRPEGMLVGTIIEMTQTGFVLKTDKDEMVDIVVSKKTRQPINIQYEVGSQVTVFGKKQDDMLEAFGVRLQDQPRPSTMLPRPGPQPQPDF